MSRGSAMNFRLVTLYSWPDGRPYRTWTRDRLRAMPRIPASILDCSVFLYGSRGAATTGDNIGGSGFLLSVPAYSPEPLDPDSEEDRAATEAPGRGMLEHLHLYLVTNRHVSGGGCRFARINTRSGATRIRDLRNSPWTDHPDQDEVSVCPIEDLCEVTERFRAIPIHMLVTGPMVNELWIGPGDDVFMIGRYVSLEGHQQNMPTARFGHIAMMPHPIKTQGLNLEGYLVEANSLAGYSGSPVFLNIAPWEVRPADPRGNQLAEEYWHRRAATEEGGGQVIWLLGINWGHLPVMVPARTEDGTDLQVQLNAGMMCVSPAWKIIETLNSPELARLRANDRERWRAEGDAILD
jgi:hypothetical protein